MRYEAWAPEYQYGVDVLADLRRDPTGVLEHPIGLTGSGAQVAKNTTELRNMTKNLHPEEHQGGTPNYGPEQPIEDANLLKSLAGAEGLEPPTLGFGDRCSTN